MFTVWRPNKGGITLIAGSLSLTLTLEQPACQQQVHNHGSTRYNPMATFNIQIIHETKAIKEIHQQNMLLSFRLGPCMSGNIGLKCPIVANQRPGIIVLLQTLTSIPAHSMLRNSKVQRCLKMESQPLRKKHHQQHIFKG